MKVCAHCLKPIVRHWHSGWAHARSQSIYCDGSTTVRAKPSKPIPESELRAMWGDR